MFQRSSIFILLVFSASQLAARKEKPALHVLGLLPYYQQADGWPNGHYVIPAVQLAVSHVNREGSGVLARYQLTLHMKNGGCLEPTVALTSVGKALLEEQPILGIIGAPCTTGSIATSKLSNHFGTSQVSFGSEFAEMSDTTSYPFFFRTTTSFAHAADGFSKLLKFLNRRSVIVVAQIGHWERPASSFAIKFKRYGGLNNTVIYRSLLTSDDNEKSMNIKLNNIRSYNKHVIVTFLDPNMTSRLMCRAYRLGMTYPNYLWIHHLTTGEWEWWNNNAYFQGCSSEEMQLAHSGSLIHQLQLNTTNETRYGQFIDQYKSRLGQYLRDLNVTFSCSNPSLPCLSSIVDDQYARTAYDAVWVLATALDRADTALKAEYGLNLSHFEQGINHFSKAIQDSLKVTDFAGLSGDIKYQRGDSRTLDKNTRSIKSGFFQIINGQAAVRVAKYDAALPDSDQLLPETDAYLLAINDSVPEDKDIPHLKLFYQEVGYVILACNAIFLLATVVLLVLNNVFSYHQPFKGSDVSLTNFQIGATLLLTTGSTIMSTFASVDIDNPIAFGAAANSSVWMVEVGLLFFLVIAASKSYRFYKIFVNYLSHSQSLSVKNIVTLSSIVLGVSIVFESASILLEPLHRSDLRSCQMREHGVMHCYYTVRQVQYTTFLFLLVAATVCVFLVLLAQRMLVQDMRYYDIHSNAMLSVGIIGYCVALVVAMIVSPAVSWPFAHGVASTLVCVMFVQIFFVWSLLWRFYALHRSASSSSRIRCHCKHSNAVT